MRQHWPSSVQLDWSQQSICAEQASGQRAGSVSSRPAYTADAGGSGAWAGVDRGQDVCPSDGFFGLNIAPPSPSARGTVAPSAILPTARSQPARCPPLRSGRRATKVGRRPASVHQLVPPVVRSQNRPASALVRHGIWQAMCWLPASCSLAAHCLFFCLAVHASNSSVHAAPHARMGAAAERGDRTLRSR